MALDAAAVGFFAILLAVTVVWQFQGVDGIDRFRKHDVLNIVPYWTFFAPNPGRHDYHVLVRSASTPQMDLDRCPWRQLSGLRNRRTRDALWHPRKRTDKALFDCVSAIGTLVPQLSGIESSERFNAAICFTGPYMLLLQRASIDAAQRGHDSCQFVVARTTGYGNRVPPRIILLSLVHSI